MCYIDAISLILQQNNLSVKVIGRWISILFYVSVVIVKRIKLDYLLFV